MKIKVFGANRFGQEIIEFETVNDSSTYNQFDYIIIQNTKSDGHGNGSFDMTISCGDQSNVSWAKGWKINEIRGVWDWIGKRVYVTIEFRYTSYSKSDTLKEVAYDVLKKMVHITENYENSVELLLVEGRKENYDEINFKRINGEGDIDDFEKNRKKVLEYWSTYSQYVNNPVELILGVA